MKGKMDMQAKKEDTGYKLAALIVFIAMIAVNVLSEILPIGGVTTKEVSDSYPNLFAPAAITFAIWGVIYILLAAFTVFQLKWPRGAAGGPASELAQNVRLLFTMSSLANIFWIFAWHNNEIPLSLAFTLIMLLCLIAISKMLASADLKPAEKIFVRLPFSVYFGWLTVATVANVTVLLVSLGWDGFGISPEIWTVAILIVAALIAIAVMLKNSDIAYGLVLLWAYAGILYKHVAEGGFGGEYPVVIATAIGCIAMFAASIIFIFITKTRVKKSA